MALADSQKISRVLTGKPFGDGKDGVGTVSAFPNTIHTYTGTAASTSGTAGSTSFANGDLVLCHQTQGTGVGQWEINMVASGGGTTSLVMQEANKYTYVIGAQIIKVPRYTTATVSAHSSTAWNGSYGGVEVIVARKSITVSGALSVNGKGFRGATTEGSGDHGYYGEGSTDLWNTKGYSSGTNSGGGGYLFNSNNCQGGGGGGNGTAGTVRPGYAQGIANLTSIIPGGGGGSGTKSANTAGHGGDAGGVIILISNSITLSAAVTANGNAGQDSSPTGTDLQGAGGGGAGGDILCICGTASLTTYITATGGAKGTGSGNESLYAGIGGTGRIAVHHSDTVTGTTSPTFSNTEDSSLIETTTAAIGGYAFFL